MTDPTPMDRLRDVGLTPELPREELRLIVAEAVQEVQERLDELEAERRAWILNFRLRPRRERP